MFFALLPARAILSDLNADLIGTYIALKTDWRAVLRQLEIHAQSHSNKYYYEVRADRPKDEIDRAAWFLYLNRACFNGLYRVNQRGEFNVPRGTKDRIIFDYDEFDKVANALLGAELLPCDFEMVINRAGEGDFVYVDPPYTVKHNNNGFLKYNENIFSWADQERLAAAVKRAADRGVQILVSNADHDSIVALYDGIGIVEKISRYSVIGGGEEYRAQISEIVVRVGYE